MLDGETVSGVARRFGVNPQTVRQWAAQFAPFLSDSANPDKGETRLFVEDDLQVFALIAYMRGRGASFDEIQQSLDSGQRGLMMDIAGAQGFPIAPTEGAVNAGAYLARVEDLAHNLGELRGKVGRIEVELREEKDAHNITRQKEAELRERAAAAEERARLVQSLSSTPAPAEPRDVMVWRWALVAGVVAIAILLTLQVLIP